LSVVAQSSGAATWYVATTGSDSNPGTSAAPFASVQRGVNAAGPGDTILVGDGTYGYSGAAQGFAVTLSKAGSAGAWITLQAQHPGAAILDCRLSCHSYINFASGSAYWTIRGFDIRNGFWGGIFSNSGGAQNVLIQSNIIHHIGNRPETSPYGIMGIYTDAGASNFRVDGNIIHDVGRTANQDGRHDHGIYAHGGMTITNNVFYNVLNGWHIQTADGFHGAIANNTFIGETPQTSTNGQIILWGADSNVLVRNNIFYGARGSGVATYAVTIAGSCTMDHNLVFGSGSPGFIDSAPSGCSPSSNILGQDPKLVSPQAPNWNAQLQEGSPAIGSGAAVSGLSTDFAGNPRPSPGFDLGAYQYVAPTPQPPTTSLPRTAQLPSTAGPSPNRRFL
jgi:hypothetical protein